MIAAVVALALLVHAEAGSESAEATLQHRKQVGRAFAVASFVVAAGGLSIALGRLRRQARDAERAEDIERAYREIEAELEPRRAPRRPRDEEKPDMRIVSLNIAQLAGKSALIPLARVRAPRVAPRLGSLLVAERPDVLALQEAPAKHGDYDPVAELLAPGRTHVVRASGPRHGPALLTGHAVGFQSARHFKPDSFNGKGWALAEVATDAGRVLVASIHLATLSPASRRRQIERLGLLLDAYDGLIVGDVNSGGAAPLALSQRLGLIPHSAGPTFPSSAPTLQLDWAFTTPRIRVRSLVSLSHLPTDHCALRLDVELP